MDRLHGRVPYGISVGNHDMKGDGNSSLFQRYFPESRFADFAWYGGCFRNKDEDQTISGNNANSCQLLSAGGLDFVFLHLECNAPDNVLAWADQVLERHADRRALVTTHMGLGPQALPRTPRDFFDAPKGRMQWKKRHGRRGNTPEQMWQKCFRKHKNLFIIFCGDQSRTQAMHQTTLGENGNPIHEALSDYGASGLRLYRFVPQKNTIEVCTFSPFSRKLCEGTGIVPDRGEHQFTLKYDMSRASADKAIEGRWKVVQHSAKPAKQKIEWIVSETTVRFVVDGKDLPNVMRFRLDATTKPCKFDAIIKEGDSTSTHRHIMRLDGDRLTLKAYKTAGADYPADFNVEPNMEMVVLERVRTTEAR